MKSFSTTSKTNNQSVNLQEQDSNVKNSQKSVKNKKLGFLGGIFASKKKVSEEDMYDDVEEQVSTPQNNTSRETVQDKKGKFGVGVKNNKQVMNNIQQTTQSNPQKLMNDTESKAIYNVNLLNQTIFLYAEPRYWGQFQNYISIFDKVICLGTSDVNILEKQFRVDNTSNIILLFIFNISEIVPIASFLTKLNLESLSEGLLSIMIVRDKSIDISKLQEVPGFSKYCSAGVLNKEQITQQTLIQIMGSIVKKQSPYPNVKPFEFPDKADKNLYRTANGVSGLNLDYIKQIVNQAREDTSSTVVMETVKKQLILSQSDSVSGLNLVQNNIPYLKFISDICDDNDKKIENLRNNPRLRKEFEVAIQDKIALCALTTRQVKDTVQHFIKTAREEMDTVMNDLGTIEPQDISEWEKMNIATSEMMKKRNEMRDNVQKKYKMYMTQAKLVLACQQVEQRVCANVNNLLVNTLKVDGNLLSSENVTLIKSITNKMKELQVEAKDAGENVKKELIKAFNMSNALLDESSKLIEVDDIVFESLQKEIDLLSRNQNVKLKVDSRLKERATLVYNFKHSGLYSLLRFTLNRDDMIVSVGRKNNDDFLNLGDIKVSSENLIDVNLDSLKDENKLIEIQWDLDYTDNTDFILTAIDYLSAYCGKVYIVINAYDETSERQVFAVEEFIRNNIARVCYFTNVDEANMLHVNYFYNQLKAYTNIMVHNVTFNKVIKNNTETKSKTDLNELYSMAGFSQSVTMNNIPELPSMLNGIKPAQEVLEQIKKILEKM